MNKSSRITCFLLATLLIFSFLGCNNPISALVGKWSYGSGNYTTVWDFKSDGSLTVTYNDSVTELKFTSVDADTIHVTGIPSTPSEADIDFKINGDTLTMTAMGNSQEFTRIK